MKFSIITFILTIIARASFSIEELQCCNHSSFPYNQIWISQSRSGFQYIFYDLEGSVTKLLAHEVNYWTGTLEQKVLDVDSNTIRCPQSFRTGNPNHAELMRNAQSQILCIRNLAAGPWYVICRDTATCRSCYLERISVKNMAATNPPGYTAYLTISPQSSNLTFVRTFDVFLGVNYNVLLEILGGSGTSGKNEYTINATQRSSTHTLYNVSKEIYQYPFNIIVKPFVAPVGINCLAFGRRQVYALPPLPR